MLNCLAVGCGGFLGSILRYLCGFIPVSKIGSFPLGTLLINVSGAFLLGLIVAYVARGGALSPRLVLFLKVGLCGGFTTFSTFAYESVDLLGHSSIMGITYMVLSLVLGILAIYAAQLLVDSALA